MNKIWRRLQTRTKYIGGVCKREQNILAASANENKIYWRRLQTKYIEQNILAASANEQNILAASANEQNILGASANEQNILGASANEQNILGGVCK